MRLLEVGYWKLSRIKHIAFAFGLRISACTRSAAIPQLGNTAYIYCIIPPHLSEAAICVFIGWAAIGAITAAGLLLLIQQRSGIGQRVLHTDTQRGEKGLLILQGLQTVENGRGGRQLKEQL